MPEARMSSTLGKIARLPLRAIPLNAEWPVLSGALRGKKWVVRSTRRACWLGIYERYFQRLLAQELRPASVFYDIGANVGFYSLLASPLVAPGKVFAFEPAPRNLAHLRRHLELNRVNNVEVCEVAISDGSGWESFDEGQDGGSGHLGAGNLRVRTDSIDGLMSQGQISPPHCIKLDVEGAERRVLAGARNCLQRYRPLILLATHGSDVHNSCREFLLSLNYSFELVHRLPEGRADVVARFKR
jgi:FkbM family methyltransferase